MSEQWKDINLIDALRDRLRHYRVLKSEADVQFMLKALADLGYQLVKVIP